MKTAIEWIYENSSHLGEECLIWPFGTSSGYSSVRIPTRKYTKAHRLMCEVAHGPPPFDKAVTLHSCDNKRCVNPQHLRWGTAAQNSKESVEREKTLRGEQCSWAKLSKDDVQQARRLREQGLSYSQLERLFGVSKGSIWHAVNGSQWKHLK